MSWKTIFQRKEKEPEIALNLYLERGVTERTQANDIQRIRPFLQQCGFKRLQDIQKSDLDNHFAAMEKRFSAASLSSYKQTFKAFFNWCVKSDEIALEKSPAAHLRVRRRNSARHKAANEKDVLKVINALTGRLECPGPKLVRDLLAFRLAYEGGNRRKELATLPTQAMKLALRLPKVNSDGVVVYVALSGEGKLGRVPIRFTEYTAAVYRLWEEVRPKKSRHRVFIAVGGSFPGEPLTLDGFTSIFVKRCREFGVPIFRTHSLRHLKGTKTTDNFTPRIAASMLNITLETAMMHYYNEDEQKLLDATAQ